MRDISDVWALVPAFNEENSIARVVTELKEIGVAGVIVVNDGSGDSTGPIARKSGAIVLTHLINQGVGAAIRTGLNFALSNKINYIVQVDGDGQHSIQSIPYMLKVETVDLVIGCRDWKLYKFGILRVIGRRLLQFLLSLNNVHDVDDPTSGFRLFNKKAIRIFASEMPPNYLGDTVEALIIAKRNNLITKGIKVEMTHREFGDSSHTGLKAAKAFMFTVLITISHLTIRRKAKK